MEHALQYLMPPKMTAIDVLSLAYLLWPLAIFAMIWIFLKTYIESFSWYEVVLLHLYVTFGYF